MTFRCATTSTLLQFLLFSAATCFPATETDSSNATEAESPRTSAGLQLWCFELIPPGDVLDETHPCSQFFNGTVNLDLLPALPTEDLDYTQESEGLSVLLEGIDQDSNTQTDIVAEDEADLLGSRQEAAEDYGEEEDLLGERQDFVGQVCTAPSGEYGLCRPLEECPPYRRDLAAVLYLRRLKKDFRKSPDFKRLAQAICSRQKTFAFLCCPKSALPQDNAITFDQKPQPAKAVATNQATTTTTTKPSTTVTTTTEPSTTTTTTTKPSTTTVKAVKQRKQCVLTPTPPAENFNNQEICGLVDSFNTPKVINGQPVEVGDYPWVGLFIKRRGYPQELCEKSGCSAGCAGTYIGGRWLLTAAHCRKPRTIRMGEYDVGDPNESIHQDFRVIRMIRHPDYKTDRLNKHDNDIALIEIDISPEEQEEQIPVCLPTAFLDVDIDEYQPIVTGWGRTKEKDAFSGSSQLLYAQVPVVNLDVCKRQYNVSDKLSRAANIGFKKLCAGKEGTDSCVGDSGGGLFFTQPQSAQFVIMGVVSFARGCAQKGFAGVYTDVRQYLDWIQEVTATTCQFNR